MALNCQVAAPGTTRTVVTATIANGASDVTVQEPFVAFDRLGLKLVQPDE